MSVCRSVWTNFPKSCPSSWTRRGWVCLSGPFDLLSLHQNLHPGHDASQPQCVVAWSNKAAARCWKHNIWHLTALCVHSMCLCLLSRKWLRPRRWQSRRSYRTLSKSEWAALVTFPLFHQISLCLVPLTTSNSVAHPVSHLLHNESLSCMSGNH